MPKPKKIIITEQMVSDALGEAGAAFSVGSTIRRSLAEALTKKLNPPAWRVEQPDGRSTPVIYYRETPVQLHVYSGTPTADRARRLHIAELVVECLNTRGLEVE